MVLGGPIIQGRQKKKNNFERERDGAMEGGQCRRGMDGGRESMSEGC